MATVSEIAVQYRARGARAAQRADRNVRESIQATADTARQEAGTINRWMQRHKQAIQSIGAATAGVMGAILAASPTFRAEMSGIRTAFSLLADTIVRDVLPGGNSLAELAFDLQEAYRNLPDPIREAASSVILFGGIIGGVGLALSAFVSGPIALLIGGVAALAAAFATDFMGIRSTVMSVLGQIRPFVRATLNRLTQLWNQHGRETVQSVRQMVTFVQGLWNAFGGRITAILRNALQLSVGIARTSLKLLLETFDLITDVLVGDWKGAWESVKSLVKITLKGVVSITKNYIGIIKNAIGLVIDAILAPFRWLYNKLVGNSLIPEMFGAIPGVIRDKLPGIKGAAGAIGSAIINALPSPGDMVQKGKDIANGIANGLRSGVDKVGNAAGAVANAIGNKLPGSDAEEGPLSNWTDQIGELREGPARELEAGAAQADRASSNLAGAASPGLDATASERPATGQGGGNMTVDITIERGAIQMPMRGGTGGGEADTQQLAQDIFDEAERRSKGQTGPL